MLDLQAGMLSEKLLQGPSWMGGRIIQEDGHRAAHMAQQLAEKHADLLLPDIVEVELIVQAEALSSGTHRDSGNNRNFVSASLAVIVNRSTPLRGPSSGHVGNQQEARFIGED